MDANKPVASAKVEDISANTSTLSVADVSLNKNEVLRRRRESARDCGLVDLDNGSYKSTIVVQTNNLGIPGLVTSMDQIYEISCNYSSMLGGKVVAAANMTVHGPQPSLIQPRGKIELGNPVLMQMNAAGNGSHPVIQVKNYRNLNKQNLINILRLNLAIFWNFVGKLWPWMRN